MKKQVCSCCNAEWEIYMVCLSCLKELTEKFEENEWHCLCCGEELYREIDETELFTVVACFKCKKIYKVIT